MEGIYLDGNLKLKKPTYTNLIYIGVLLENHGFAKMVSDKIIASRLLKRLCIKKKGSDLAGKLNPILVAKVVIDFFSEYYKSVGLSNA